MGILAWIILGLLAGAIAKLIHPGPDPGGALGTLLVGVLGSIVGGLVGRGVFGHGITGFNFWSFLLAVIGAFLLLTLYRVLISRSGPRRVA